MPTPDIIHWNNGLWDTAIINGEDRCFADIDTYIDNMKRIIRVLKSTGAKVLFATTTPVSPLKETLDSPPLPNHRNSDIIEYNKKAVTLMNSEGIAINDLFSLVYPHIDEYISEDMIHPNEKGVEVLADRVAEFIKLF